MVGSNRMIGGKRWLVLAAPLLLTGCGVLNFAPDTYDTLPPEPADPGPGWLVVAEGDAVPSPMPLVRSTPSPKATEGFLEADEPAPYPKPVPNCTDTNWRIGDINGLNVDMGPDYATAKWTHIGGANVVAYRLTAISQDLVAGKQRDVGWVTVKPTAPCGELTARLTGLDRRTRYMFSLDAVTTRKSGDGTRASTVLRTLVVSTT